MSSSRPRRTRASRPPDDLDLLSDTLFGPSHGERHDTRRDRARGLGPLCREVERTLTYALAAAGDERLRDLMVICVTPAPNAGRLAVLVAPASPVDIDERRELLAQLDRARGRLRAELASVLQRKRTPELAFMLADDEGGDP